MTRNSPVSNSEPTTPPQNRIVETFNELLAGEQLLEGARFQERGRITLQELNRAVESCLMFYIEVGGVRAYPAFYLDQTLARAQVEAISVELGELSGGSKWLFFTQRSGFLALPETGQPQSPLEALRHGRFAKVRQAAHGFKER